jgi:hypothetical protein
MECIECGEEITIGNAATPTEAVCDHLEEEHDHFD